MRINLPNQITLARLILAAAFFALLARFDVRFPQVWILDACLALFIVAAATDVLDGYLARKQNQITALGRIMDPFVDKILVCGAFVFLAGPGFVLDGRNVAAVSPWMVVLILGREFLVTSLRGFSEAQGKSFAATIYGKAKMVLQSIAVAVVLFYIAHLHAFADQYNLSLIPQTFVWAAVVVTVLSMLGYLVNARDYLKDAYRA